MGNIVVNIPFSYERGQEGYFSGNKINSFEDAKEEVVAELEGGNIIYSELFMQELQPKETRVYVLSADIDLGFPMSGYEIQNWLSYQENHGKLPPNAELFIEEAEKQGSVYSLYGFHEAFNIEQSVGNNDYIFITAL